MKTKTKLKIGKLCTCPYELTAWELSDNGKYKIIPSNDMFTIINIIELTGEERGLYDIYLLTHEGELRFTTVDNVYLGLIQSATHD